MDPTLTVHFGLKYDSGAAVSARFAVPSDQLITVLYGPSGSGKTTILRVLAGLETPAQGEIRCGGAVWLDTRTGVHLAPQERKVGYVFQDYALFPHLDVESNIAYGVARNDEAARERVAGLLDRFELQPLRRQRPAQLSGGQAQRVALARALARSPQLLLLDEPLAALDENLRSRLRAELRRLLTELRIPVVMVSHEQKDAITMADRVVVVINGRVEQEDRIERVFSNPVNEAVARCIGVETIVEGEITGEQDGVCTIDCGGIHIHAISPENRSGSRVVIGIRAEDVSIERDRPDADSPRNHLPGVVCAVIREGAVVRVQLDCGIPLAAAVTRQSAEQLGLRPGTPIIAAFKATAITVFPR